MIDVSESTRKRSCGKGDQGVQPRNWGDRKIVVQDPFLWHKASGPLGLNPVCADDVQNCAGQMSGKGVERFLEVSCQSLAIIKLLLTVHGYRCC